MPIEALLIDYNEIVARRITSRGACLNLKSKIQDRIDKKEYKSKPNKSLRSAFKPSQNENHLSVDRKTVYEQQHCTESKKTLNFNENMRCWITFSAKLIEDINGLQLVAKSEQCNLYHAEIQSEKGMSAEKILHLFRDLQLSIWANLKHSKIIMRDSFKESL